MNRISFIIFLFILTACKSTKQTIAHEKVCSGQDLEKIDLVSFDSFFNQWVYNRRIQKVDLNLKEVYIDEQFTYFGKPKLGLTQTKWTFFKVHTDTLIERFPNYKDFYGTELNDYLWTKVIPKEDLELWSSNRTAQQNEIKPNCPFKRNKPRNNYSLIDKKIILKVTWDIECQELERLKNKEYKASFNLMTQEYDNESPDNK